MVLRCVAALLLAGIVRAHDIPNDVTVRLTFHPEGQILQMRVSAPMSAMRDVDTVQDAAKVWIADAIAVYEGEERVQGIHVVDARDTNGTLHVALEAPIVSDHSEFSIHPGFGRLGLRVLTALTFAPPGGGVRAFEFHGDPGVVRLDPRWYQAAALFVKEGTLHILGGTDHLLFLVCLVIPFRQLRALIPIVTAFTAAHSVTLIAAAYGFVPDYLWFSPLVETLIAASIVYMALENIVGAGTVPRRWMTAFGFGLVHGFGFSFALKETLQFAGSHLLASLVAFNVGIEIGQLVVLAALVPALELLFRKVVAERMGTILLSAIVAHTAWHWMLDRGDRLLQYRFTWPEWTAAEIASLLRWSMVVVGAAAVIWLARLVWNNSRAAVSNVPENNADGHGTGFARRRD